MITTSAHEAGQNRGTSIHPLFTPTGGEYSIIYMTVATGVCVHKYTVFKWHHILMNIIHHIENYSLC